MSDTSGSGGDGSPYPGQGNQPPPPPGSQPPPYPGTPPPGYPQGQPPAYGSPPPAYGAAPPAYGGAPPPAYPGAYGYGEEPQGKTGVSGLAIAALIVAIVIPLVGLFIAVPLAIAALIKIGKSRQTGKWAAILGIIISVLWWAGFIVLIVFVATDTAKRDSSGVINEKGRIDFGDIQVGDCVTVPDLGTGENIDTFDLEGVPCTASHNAEASGIVAVSGSAFPGEDALSEQGDSACTDKGNEYLAGADPTGLLTFSLYPTEGIWDSDNGHRIVCFIIHDDFSSTSTPIAK